MAPDTPPGWHDLPASVSATAPVWLGFSGGEDSLLLAHLLAERWPDRLTCLHVHHRQISEDDAIARACERLAGAAGWRLVVAESPVVADEIRALGPEAAARLARQRAFAARMPPGTVRATAHHRRDQAETLLLRLLRGTGPAGLGGMQAFRRLDAPAHGWLWRPLLDVPKSWIAAEAARRGLEPVADPLNDDPRLARARLRQSLWPALLRGWPQAEASLARLAGLARAESELLAGYVKDDLRPRRVPVENYPGFSRSNSLSSDPASAVTDSGPARVVVEPVPPGPGLSLTGWTELPPARRHALARAWLGDQGFAAPPAAWLARLDAEVARAAPDRHPRLRLGVLEVRRTRGALWAFARL